MAWQSLVMSEKALLAVIATGLVLGLAWPGDKPAQPVVAPIVKAPRPFAAPAPQQVSSGFATTIPRAPDGHFYADARVNGQPVRFMIDTGASAVALTSADARRIGLFFEPHEFAVIGKGASGDVRGKAITLDSVEVDGKSASGVRAAILDEGLDISLLGQSYLAQLGEVKISGDTMELRSR